MPTIAMFYGMIVQMYSDDHNLPHIHVRYAEFKASYDLDGGLLAGKLPQRQHNFIVAWVQLNKEMLEANWENVKCNVPVIRIEG